MAGDLTAAYLFAVLLYPFRMPTPVAHCATEQQGNAGTRSFQFHQQLTAENSLTSAQWLFRRTRPRLSMRTGLPRQRVVLARRY